MSDQSLAAANFRTTIDYLVDVPCFAERSRLITIPPYNPFVDYGIADQIRIFWRVLQAAKREKALLLFSSRGRFKPELLAIAIIGFLPKRCRPIIVLNGDMWEPDGGLRGIVERFIVRLADRAIARYAVYSSAELIVFPQTWGVDPDKMRFTPYYSTVMEDDASSAAREAGDYIFAGGNRFRDYEPLVEAARRLPEYSFVMATRRLEGVTGLPPNILSGEVPPQEFARLLKAAVVVVVPMRQGLRRSTGHQTYLNAMKLKKPTIVNDVYGVRDHVRDHGTGLIVDGSAYGYVQALRWVLDPANKEKVQQMCEYAARDVSDRFSPETHARHLLAVMDEVMQIPPRELT